MRLHIHESVGSVVGMIGQPHLEQVIICISMKQEVQDLALEPFLESPAHERMMAHAVAVPRSTVAAKPTGLFGIF